MIFKIFGLDKLTAKLRRLSAPQLTSEIKKTTLKATLYVHGKLPSESSIPTRGTYKRTGRLGRELHSEVKGMGSGFVGIIGSPTPYSPWVISTEAAHGAGPQVSWHKGRWYTLQAHLKKYQKDVNKFFEDLVRRLTK